MKNQLYDLLCAVLLGILFILQQLGARPVQLYDSLVAFLLGGASKKEQIIKLGHFLNNTFAFLLGATQLYDFVCFVSRAWAGVQKANRKVDQLYDFVCFVSPAWAGVQNANRKVDRCVPRLA